MVETPIGLLTLADAARASGIPYDRLKQRLNNGTSQRLLFVVDNIRRLAA